MKLKNILSFFCFLAAMASCSMDDETVMNDISKEINSSTSTSKEALVSFQLDMNGLTTKSVTDAGTDNTVDQEVNNIVIFLLNGDNVIDYALLNKADGDFSQSGNVCTPKADFGFLTKKVNTLKLMVIANSNITASTVSNYTTGTQVKAASTNLADCAKFGESNITWIFADGSEYPGYEKINGTDGVLAHSYAVNVAVKQAYARVELASFNVKKQIGSDNVDVTLMGVKLCNINTRGRVDGAVIGPVLAEPSDWNFRNGLPSCNTGEAECSSSVGKNILANNNVFFRTFAYDYSNVEDDKEMYLEISYKIGVQSQLRTKKIVIEGKNDNLKAVEAGYIYRINLTASVRPEQVDLDVIFSIDKWIDGGVLVDGNLTANRN
ncbi:hypothetical protein [uncultured Parabacteroides sp.]|uniref:hypothetical protein n=1 Tax=uncultured Parabacteroides sp. TaxID=512312 RepID=UPI002637AA4A|nr:hypothetical protein [uncultured Parabacteroides sp.]